jgi:hypothetical protein
MLSSSPSKITDLAIPGASLRPADLAAPAKLRNTRGRGDGKNAALLFDVESILFSSGITDASPLYRSPGLQLPPHPASAICPRRAAPQSVGRPARPRRTRPQPYAPNRSPPETHRQAGCGARASRPRRPSFEAERRRAGGGRSPLRPSVRVVHHSRSVPVECRQSSAAHEGFGERSRWGAVSTPRYRSALSNNRRAEHTPRSSGDRSAHSLHDGER